MKPRSYVTKSIDETKEVLCSISQNFFINTNNFVNISWLFWENASEILDFCDASKVISYVNRKHANFIRIQNFIILYANIQKIFLF